MMSPATTNRRLQSLHLRRPDREPVRNSDEFCPSAYASRIGPARIAAMRISAEETE